MIDRETLARMGYELYPNPMNRGDYDKWLWQKRITDNAGTRYFIDFQEFDTSEIRNWSGPKLVYEAHVVFYDSDEEEAMRVHLGVGKKDLTIERIEAECDRIWTRLELGYYERT